MRTLIKFLKKRTPFEIALLLLIIGLVIMHFVTRMDVRRNPATSFVAGKIDEYKDKAGQNTAKVETVKQDINGVDPALYERAVRDLGIAKKNLLSVTDIEAKLRDSIRLKSIAYDELKNKKWEWETLKSSGSVIKATMSEKDSILHTDVDVKLASTDYVDKGGIFGKDRFYTDIYSIDQNIKINGVKSFRKETFVRPKRIGIGLQVGYGVSSDLKPSLYVGVGLSYNILNL